MTASEPNPGPIRLALLLPAESSCAWQEQASEQLAACPCVVVETYRVAVAAANDPRWRDLAQYAQPLRRIAVAGVSPPAPETAWDVVIDLAGVADLDPWRRRSRGGVWQPLDVQGVHAAMAYPCHDAICSGRGGELFLVRDGEQVLKTANFFASPNYRHAFALVYARSIWLVQSCLSEFAQGCLAETATPFAPRQRPNRLMRAWHGRHGQGLALRRRLVAQWRSEHWMIGIIDAPIQHVLDARVPPSIKWLGKHESDYYRADPFGVPGRRDQLYCENYNYRDGRGGIEALCLDDDNRIVHAQPVPLRSPGHASYPCVFAHDGRVYGIPETADRRHCELYEITETGRWRYVASLLDDVAAADASLFCWEGRYWLAYTDLALSPFDNLCLSYANELTGPWQRHAQHPVKFDQRSSRSGGTPFVHDGKLYRPAQDCSARYGGAITINHVSLCTPHRYREETISVYAPDPHGRNPHGLHTLSAWGARTLVDGKRHGFSRHEFIRKIRRKMAISR